MVSNFIRGFRTFYTVKNVLLIHPCTETPTVKGTRVKPEDLIVFLHLLLDREKKGGRKGRINFRMINIL